MQINIYFGLILIIIGLLFIIFRSSNGLTKIFQAGVRGPPGMIKVTNSSRFDHIVIIVLGIFFILMGLFWIFIPFFNIL